LNPFRHHRPDLDTTGVVAVSGGADSVALLRFLLEEGKRPLVAHVNHQLRGADSDADEQFVRDLAASFRLPCRTLAIDVKAQASRTGENLEAVARRLRYDFLIRIAQENNADWVATGHTADDQAETVLHRLLRGAGIQGLRGIAHERTLAPGIRLVRPLLDTTREEIIAYLESLNQPWREDATNRDPAFTRNRIRHQLLPLLRSFNPAIAEVLGRLAAQAGEVHLEELEAAHALLKDAELPSAGELQIFSASRLQAAPGHHVRAMFRALWEREAWPRNDMTFEHWKRLVAIAHGLETATDLPGGISARRKGDAIQVGIARVQTTED